MKKNIIRKIFLILGFLIFSISVISCGDCQEWPEYFFEIQFEESYDPNKDVHLSISFGLYPEAPIRDSQIQLAYSKEKKENFNDDNVTILYSIFDDDLENDYYYYTKKGNKIIFNFTKEFVIEKEAFSNGQGEIMFMMYHIDEDYHNPYLMISKEYSYKIENNNLVFYR